MYSIIEGKMKFLKMCQFLMLLLCNMILTKIFFDENKKFFPTIFIVIQIRNLRYAMDSLSTSHNIRQIYTKYLKYKRSFFNKFATGPKSPYYYERH